jgi:hypothetical protein
MLMALAGATAGAFCSPSGLSHLLTDLPSTGLSHSVNPLTQTGLSHRVVWFKPDRYHRW